MTSVRCTAPRYLRQISNEPPARKAASACERTPRPYREKPPQFLCPGKASRSRTQVHPCNAVVSVERRRPATLARPARLSSFSLSHSQVFSPPEQQRKNDEPPSIPYTHSRARICAPNSAPSTHFTYFAVDRLRFFPAALPARFRFTLPLALFGDHPYFS